MKGFDYHEMNPNHQCATALGSNHYSAGMLSKLALFAKISVTVGDFKLFTFLKKFRAWFEN